VRHVAREYHRGIRGRSSTGGYLRAGLRSGNHVSSILAKFGVRDRTRAVLKALETGLRAPDAAPR